MISSKSSSFLPGGRDGGDTNYYMEREWRALQDIHFELTNVHRIILPREYAVPFRRDFADYSSQITFAD